MSALFPPLGVFLDLAGRSVVVLGFDQETLTLARRCHGCGASVSIIDPEPRATPPAERAMRVERRRWRASDLRAAHLVIAARHERRWARAARMMANGLFVFLGDRSSSDLSFGANAAHSGVSIAVQVADAPASVEEAAQRCVLDHAPAQLFAYMNAVRRAAPMVADALRDAEQRSTFWSDTTQAALAPGAAPATSWDDFIAERLNIAAARDAFR